MGGIWDGEERFSQIDWTDELTDNRDPYYGGRDRFTDSWWLRTE